GDTGGPEGPRWWWLEPREDAEDLERDDAGAVGWVGCRADAAIVDGDRVAPGRRMRSQVVHRDRAPGGGQCARLSLAEVAVVVAIEAIARQRLQRPGEGRLLHTFAGVEGATVGPEDLVEPTTGRFARERRHRLHVVDELVGRREAVPCQVDRGSQDGLARQAPEPRVRVTPRADRAGDGDAQRPAERDAAMAVSAQPRRIDAGGASTGAVECQLPVRGRVPDEPE